MRVVCGGWNGDGGGGCGGDRGSEEAGFLHSCGGEMRDFQEFVEIIEILFWESEFVVKRKREENCGNFERLWRHIYREEDVVFCLDLIINNNNK